MSYGQAVTPGILQWHWTLSEEDSRPHIQRALELGLNFFDTANVYSNGESEAVLGRALRDFTRREEVVIATKVWGPVSKGPNGRGLSRKAILSEVDKSLGGSAPTTSTSTSSIATTTTRRSRKRSRRLNDVVRAGKVRYLGASSMYAWQFMKALGLQRAHGWAAFISMQNYYNLLYREEEREMLRLCVSEGDRRHAVVAAGAGPAGPPVDHEPTTDAAKTDAFGTACSEDGRLDKPVVDRVNEIAQGAACRRHRWRWRGCCASRRSPHPSSAPPSRIISRTPWRRCR